MSATRLQRADIVALAGAVAKIDAMSWRVGDDQMGVELREARSTLVHVIFAHGYEIIEPYQARVRKNEARRQQSSYVAGDEPEPGEPEDEEPGA